MTIIDPQQSLLDLIKSKTPEYSGVELGLAFCAVGDFKNASESLLAHAYKNRRVGQLDNRHLLTFSKTNKVKLLHDIEQFHFLQETGVSSISDSLVSAYLEVLKTAPENCGDAEFFDIPNNVAPEFLEHYNRLIYFDQPVVECKKALNPSVDWNAIDLTARQTPELLVVVDNVLTKEALSVMYRSCLSSTIWWLQKDCPKDLYTTIFDGFACPLIFQIAYEFRCALPNLLAKHVLIDGWAIKYLRDSTDVGIHADRGEVSINFWITPDEANLTPGTGGLRIWDKSFPKEYFDQPREKQKIFVDHLLADPDTKTTIIPYKCNRVTIFYSNLAHQTEPFMFSTHYADRRINVTLLFATV